MRARSLGSLLFLLMLSVSTSSAPGQDPAVPPGETDPLLRLEAGGPTSLVTAVTFSPDGETLFAAGWDKVVRVWRRDARTGGFVFDPRSTYRVPIGPGLDGAINAIALSQDGRWLAVAGRGITRGAAGFRRNGLMIPQGALSDAMYLDRGRIYVFDTKALPPTPRIFQGHLGPVVAMTFAPPKDGKPGALVSLAQELDRLGVVRLWDVEQGKVVASTAGLPDPRERPGMAAWYADPDRPGVCVSIAANDGTLYTWDVAKKTLVKGADGAFNASVASLSDGDQLLTGSFDRRNGFGQLTRWNLGEGTPKDPRRVRLRPTDPKPGLREEYIPRGIVLIPSPQGPPRHAAILLRRTRDKSSADHGLVEYDLQLVDLSPRAFGAVKAQTSLGKVRGGRAAEPTLAVDPGGRSLAVAEVIDREIDIYPVADLLQGKASPQRIGSEGASLRSVAFVRKGADRGLALSEETKAGIGGAPRARWGPRDLVLDVARRRTTAYSDEWVSSSPALEGWEVRLLNAPSRGEEKIPKAQVLRGGRRVVDIALEPRQVVTGLAILPPRAPRIVPIVAIASHDQGQPSLGLYHGTTGERVRQLTGHVERIRDLAFSDDGRLLATVGEDQMACLWSLTEIDSTLGMRGHLPGVGVIERAGRLVVGHLDADSPLRAGDALREGDVILGRVNGGRIEDFGSQFDFYRAISHERPAAKMTLRLLDSRQATRDITVTLGQAVDERKPLFSLFLTRPRGAPASDRGWIGWSPYGPYDASGPEVEPLLGWHFNTGKLEAPTEFASAEEYRKFHRQGLLKELIDQGSLPPPPPPPPLPAPGLSLTVDSQGPTDESGHVVVRSAPRTVELLLLGDKFPAEQVESVRYQVGTRPAVVMRSDADRTWSADLATLSLPPGLHRVHAVVRTKEATPQEFSAVQILRFQPERPEVELRIPAGRVVVKEPDFRFKAEVRAIGEVPVKVRLTQHRGGDSPIRKEWEIRKPSEPLTIDEPLALEPGTNTVELVAINSNALEGFAELETRRIDPVIIEFARQPIPVPRIALTRAVFRPEGTTQDLVAAIRRGEPVTVPVPRVTIEGEIEGQQPLHRANWTDDPKAEGQALARFAPGRVMVFNVKQQLKLTPGSQTIWVRAAAGDRFGESDVGADQVTILYKPQLPEIADAALDPSGTDLYLDQFRGTPRVRLTARLVPPADPHPYTVQIVLNGRVLPEPPAIDEAASRLTAEIPLEPGENQVEIRLSNAWNEPKPLRLKPVTFLRPPRVTGVKAPLVEGKTHVDVTSTVESPEDLPITKTRVTVVRPGVDPLVIDDAKVVREGVRWVVSAKAVPIERGQNTISVQAWNRDGPSRAPAPVERVVFKGLPPSKPIVALLPPSETTTEAKVSFGVRVHSTTKGRIELRRMQPDQTWKSFFGADLDDSRADGKGSYVFNDPVEVGLDEHQNSVELRVTNRDGISVATATISRITPPVRVRIDKLESATQKAEALTPVSRGENRISFTEGVSDGPVWLYGRVVWGSEEAKKAQSANRIQVWVNGFPQIETALTMPPGAGLEGQFRAGLLLNGKENRIEVKLPGIARAAGDPPTFSVACRNPEQRQRLHLLIIGVGSETEDQLKARALEALQANMVPGSEVAFTTPAFRSGILHYTLCGDVRIERVLYQLEKIRLEIKPLNDATRFPIGTEFVVIYYQGEFWMDDGKAVLQLRKGRERNNKDVISFRDLGNSFAGTRGATLCLLDVNGDAQIAATAEPWTDKDSRTGLLSFMWIRPPEGRSPEIPSDARLATVLGAAVQKTSTIGQAVEEFTRESSLISQRNPNHRSLQIVPDLLSGLLIGNP